jgi:3,4-dihydroxy 2-butanone 4-phosphate synthase / GTP cyclohydrolase II
MSWQDKIRLDPVEGAIADIADGRPVIVVDDEDRENEGDIIFAASRSTPELMAWTVRHSSGVICVPMPAAVLDRLEIPLMTPHNRDRMRTAYTISVDARDGVTTGISAADRSHTVKTLADSATEPWELTRPGHVFPLRYREGGVLTRRGHTEAAVDLARLAGLTPVGVLVEVVNDDGTMKRGQELRDFADEHGLKLISIDQLVHHRRRTESHVHCVAETRLPTRFGDFTAFGYRIEIDDSEHVALVYGDPGRLRGGEGVLCRVHSECLTGDVFGSARCDCGPQLEEAMERIVSNGSGVVVYLRGHEGRGIGLLAKLQAYQLQDGGRDTVDANLDLGLPADARHYGAATQILRDLGVTSVRLLTNNPAKTEGLEAYGIAVQERVALTPHPNDHNLAYLRTKRDRMGHDLPDAVLESLVSEQAARSTEHGFEPRPGFEPGLARSLRAPDDPDDPLSHIPDRTDPTGDLR